MSRTEKAKERYLLIFLSIIILALRLWFISEMQGPFVFSDQVGYWGHAANLNALPWQKATGIWYSYGYSILLTPLFWISHDMGVMYKLAIVLNAFIGLAGFYLGIAILRELEVNVEAKTRALISFTASCYSAYIFQTYIAWPETLIYTAILLVVWSMIRFCKKTTILNMLIVTVELVALYTIHNRNIVGIIAFFMILITMVFNRKVDWKKVVVAFITFGFFYLINKVARMYFTELMWGVDKTFGSNDVSGVVDNLKTALSSMGGWTRLVQSALGKIWYLLTSTFMLGYVGFVFILRKIAAYFRAREKKISDTEYAYFFIFLLILGTVALNILCVPGEIDYSQSTRLDVYFYGRYTDGITGLLIILGLVSLVKVKDFFFERDNSWYRLLLSVCGYVVCTVTKCKRLLDKFNASARSLFLSRIYD